MKTTPGKVQNGKRSFDVLTTSRGSTELCKVFGEVTTRLLCVLAESDDDYLFISGGYNVPVVHQLNDIQLTCASVFLLMSVIIPVVEVILTNTV